jgi:hypothetical protein
MPGRTAAPQMHIERVKAFGLEFGDCRELLHLEKGDFLRPVMDYLAGLPLTFEGRNLDHTLEFEGIFAAWRCESAA